MSSVESLSPYGWLVVAWITAIPFGYGYHISVLNQLHSVLACESSLIPNNLPTCFELNDFTFSAVTSVFNLGGLLGSAQANVLMEKFGRRGTARISALFTALGSAIMCLSGNVSLLGIGRFLTGIGSGIGICLAPLYIAEVAPKSIASTLGVLTQLGIVLGIFFTQLLGVYFSSPDAGPNAWRLVLFFSFAVALIQVFMTGFMVESPRYLRSKSLRAGEEARAIERRIWLHGVGVGGDPAASPLLDERDPEAHPVAPHGNFSALTASQTLFKPPADVRLPLLIVCCAMVGQQFSGINAVLYYSNDILSQALPELGKYVSLGITVVNVIMTFPPILLIEKLGRKPLLFFSVAGAFISLTVLGMSLNFAGAAASTGPTAWTTVSSVFIIFFVMSFAIGLGPVPFVMISEIAPFYAVSSLSTIALSLNWLTNFSVSLLFLPLRNVLSGGAPGDPHHDPGKIGRVFWVFAAILALVMSVVWRKWKV
ncbi:general substrate transporter [Lentinula edodes]|uniref:general substrate transporter n=1 Tax=Lentinula edodes TaxID=5353 RepID=UPI001E8DDE0B|nr:general substrate transporter [Lentinula edodes]KAH7877804.1 general substrate transporter [Lentinula edodes]